MLVGLLRYVPLQCKECPNFLESVSRELHESGVGAVIHHALVISLEEEEKLLNSGLLGFIP